MKIGKEQTTKIEGKEYWTIAQFARMTKRTNASIRHLISQGNRVRKLKALKVIDRLFIEDKEIFDYPFCIRGRKTKENELHIERFSLSTKGLVKRKELIRT